MAPGGGLGFGVLESGFLLDRRASMRRARAKTCAAGKPCTRTLSRSSRRVFNVSAQTSSTAGAKLDGLSRACRRSATCWRTLRGRRRFSAGYPAMGLPEFNQKPRLLAVIRRNLAGIGRFAKPPLAPVGAPRVPLIAICSVLLRRLSGSNRGFWFSQSRSARKRGCFGCGAGVARTAKSGNRHVRPLRKSSVTNPQTCRPGACRGTQKIRREALTGLDSAPDIVKGPRAGRLPGASTLHHTLSLPSAPSIPVAARKNLSHE